MKTLTPKQIEVNTHLSGQMPLRQVNELISLIENDLWDYNNASLMERSKVLCGLLSKMVPAKKTA
jgi:hypothetical protein